MAHITLTEVAGIKLILSDNTIHGKRREENDRSLMKQDHDLKNFHTKCQSVYSKQVTLVTSSKKASSFIEKIHPLQTLP